MQIEPATCPVCSASYDPLRARSVAVLDGRVRAFCSTGCKDKGLAGVEQAPSIDDALKTIQQPSAWQRLPREQKILGGAMGVVAVLSGLAFVGRGPTMRPTQAAAAVVPVAPPHTPTVAEAMDILGKKTSDDDVDVWIHPLAGPRRHLPEADTRRFGAAREGMRPEECMGGHCGVDIGTVRGDIVMAVHDGVVERVERDPEVGGHRGNEGRFIRINHKGGTVVSSYIHLDGIREDLKPGIPVKAGEPVGTVGDTGVKHSGPHLHFAISVRPSADGPELFIDPEPMLHLWPVRNHASASLHGMQITPHRPAKTAQADSSDSSEDL
jgi:murein DD-endopeptidase MepM/ murein hydrolase activator NlpD